MRHTGQLFLSRTPPQAGPARCGTFQLQLLAYDRIGPHQTEPWRIVWTGIAAKRFWQQHEAALQPGAVLRVELEAARTHALYSRPPSAEIHARVVSMEMEPHALKNSDKRSIYFSTKAVKATLL